MIDVKAILDELGIDYKESGKNVGSNDININCPFCNAEKHLGISLGSGVVNCWVCEFNNLPKRPSLTKVLSEATGLYWEHIQSVMKEHGWEPFGFDARKTENDLAPECWLPKEAYPIITGYSSFYSHSN